MALTNSVIKGNKFYLGEAELTSIIQRTIRFYRFYHEGKDPKEVVIPCLLKVEGVKISYATEPGFAEPDPALSPDTSEETEPETTDETAD